MPNQTDRKRFFQLVERYLSGNVTDAERAFLEEYFRQHETNPGLLEGMVTEAKNDLEESIRESVHQQITNVGSNDNRPGVIIFFRKYRTALSAAAILIILTGALFFFTTSKQTFKSNAGGQASSGKLPKRDVSPGHDGAILTLSDGTSIVLDSAHDGALAVQGSTQVIKKNGQVVYNKIANASGPIYNTIRTPNGRAYSLLLADSSKVWLNAASSITFPTAFTGKERSVSITGEVYFEVAHNAKLPFIVEDGTTKIKVLGTHFNVNSYDDEASNNITLLEGSVEVGNDKGKQLIRPGQQLRVNRLGAMNVINNVDLEEVMAWKNEVFKFKNTGIDVLMRQLSRWYDVEVVYNKKINDRFFVEIPRTSNLSDLLKTLEYTGRIHFEIEGKKIIVMP